jgi:hypothetical protein
MELSDGVKEKAIAFIHQNKDKTEVEEKIGDCGKPGIGYILHSNKA